MNRASSITLAILTLFTLLCIRFAGSARPSVWNAANSLESAGSIALTDDGDPDSLVQAIQSSLTYYARLGPDTPLRFGKRTVSAGEMRAWLEGVAESVKTRGLSEESLRALAPSAEIFRSAADSVLFTGYYEARLSGSKTRTERYHYPLYAAPPDLLTVKLRQFFEDRAAFPGLPDTLRARLTPSREIVPYFSRDQIDLEHALEGRNLELVWVDDPTEAFFLHIQGSGVVSFEDGTTMQIGYAEKNGRPYRAIGKLLVQKGLLTLDTVSAQNIKAKLRAHPELWTEAAAYNPSYVFFRSLEAGPVGNINVPLTAYRSIATDSSLFPKGALAFIETELPVVDTHGAVTGWKKLRRFVVNQDTGGAILGPGRVDIFSGFGAENEAIAGAMKREGRLFFLAPPATESGAR